MKCLFNLINMLQSLCFDSIRSKTNISTNKLILALFPHYFYHIAVDYGNVSVNSSLPDSYIDGSGNGAGIVRPQYLYQTEDKSKILFVDDASCAREIDRSTGVISTRIGECFI